MPHLIFSDNDDLVTMAWIEFNTTHDDPSEEIHDNNTGTDKTWQEWYYGPYYQDYHHQDNNKQLKIGITGSKYN